MTGMRVWTYSLVIVLLGSGPLSCLPGIDPLGSTSAEIPCVVKIQSPIEGSNISGDPLWVEWKISDPGPVKKVTLIAIQDHIQKDYDITNHTRFELYVNYGEYEITVEAYLDDGSSVKDSVNFFALGSLPHLKILYPYVGIPTKSEFSLEFEACGLGNITMLNYRIDGGIRTPIDPNLRSVPIRTSLGNHTLVLELVDEYGYVRMDTRFVIIDDTRPYVKEKLFGIDSGPYSTIQVQFSEPLDPLSVQAHCVNASFKVLVRGEIWCDIYPLRNLSYSSNYTIFLTGTDLAGNPIENGAINVITMSERPQGVLRFRLINEKGEEITGKVHITTEGDGGEYDVWPVYYRREIAAGDNTLVINVEGYEKYERKITIEPYTVTDLGDIKLQEKKDFLHSYGFTFFLLINLIIISIFIILYSRLGRNGGGGPE